MEISEVNSIVEDIEKRIKNIKDMLVDYNVCTSETSKSILLAAISKYVSQVKPQTTK